MFCENIFYELLELVKVSSWSAFASFRSRKGRRVDSNLQGDRGVNFHHQGDLDLSKNEGGFSPEWLFVLSS